MLPVKRLFISASMLVASLILFIASYFLIGAAAHFSEGFFAECAAVLGLTLYFVSLRIAIHTRMRPLIATISTLGGLLGLIFIAGVFSLGLPSRFSVIVILALLTNCVFFVRFLRSRKNSASQ